MEQSTPNPSPKISTVYGLYDESGTIRYVGITCQPLKNRLRMHMNDAKRGSRTYCASWIRSMLQPPTIVAIETTFDRTREVFWIAEYRAVGARLTNLTDGGEGVPGLIFTDEHRQRISSAVKQNYDEGFISPRKGKKSSPEHCAKIAIANTGRVHSPETLAKIGAASRMRKVSDETRAKMSEASKGRPCSEETRRKLAQVHLGRVVSEETRAKMQKPKSPEHCAKLREAQAKRRASGWVSSSRGIPLSEETRAKLSASHRGKKVSDETRMKLSAARRRRVLSEETKAKISAAKKAYYANLRQQKHVIE